jgi:hypothetical protein
LNANKKSVITAIALILALALTIILPIANAHDPPWNVPTWAFLSVGPNPVGVNQHVFVNFWLDKTPPTANGPYGDSFENLKITVTKPDGTTQILGPFETDAVGGAWSQYTPTEVGTYTLVFDFPGQTIEGKNPHPIFGTSDPASVGDYYEPSTSQTVTLVVQEDPVVAPDLNPLPTGYWERPVQSTNSLWAPITGNWLGLSSSTFAATGMYNSSGNFNPYTTAPNTAHIVWTKPVGFGGMIGGEFGGSQTSNYYSTSQYEPKFAPIIMNGILYYMNYPGSQANPEGWYAVDLRTGEVLWTKDISTPLSCGMTYNYQSPNQYGGLAYLWTGPSGFFAGPGTWSMYEAKTGDWILDIENGTTMTKMEAADGALIGYYTNFTDGTLNMWNSSKCILDSAPENPFYQGAKPWFWRPPQGETLEFGVGIEWSVPIADNINGVPIIPGLGINGIGGGAILMTARPGGFGFNTGWQIEAAYDPHDGRLLWGPINRTVVDFSAFFNDTATTEIYTHYIRETMEWTGFSLTTGQKVWGPIKSDTNAWGYYGVQYVPAYGNLYAWDFGGTVNCFDMQTGELKWTWNTGTAGYETPYGVWPLWTFTCGTVADGKIYVPEGHMYSPPLFHGAKQWCLDAMTGEPIWSIMGFDVTSAPAIADGYMVTLNAYDNQLYCYGKTNTGTTISVPDTSIPEGEAVVIKGTVTDQGPGQTCLGIPAAGTPAISDDDMSEWMEYLYMQQAKPVDAAGVQVRLTATDPNGNWQEIGTATSDDSGTYSFMWTPPVPGLYTITATFEGSESYFSSYTRTALGVDEAPQATPEPTPTPASMTDTYLAGSTIAILAGIAVAVFLILRKK